MVNPKSVTVGVDTVDTTDSDVKVDAGRLFVATPNISRQTTTVNI